jgi:AcrR family transcriptional regulator
MPKVSQEHMDQRRQQILAAANRCFARLGFHDATMQDIIGEAGLSAGAIYNHFSSKENIIIAIADERHAREAEVCRAAANEVDAFAALMHLGQAFFHDLSAPGQEEERRVGVQLWAEALNNRKLLKVTLEGSVEPLRVLKQLMDRLKASGDLSQQVNSEAMARVMVALFQGLVLQKCREKNLDIEPYVEATLFLARRMLADTGRSKPKMKKGAQAPSGPRQRNSRTLT